MPRPITSANEALGLFAKDDFVYDPAQDVYRCPAGETLTYRTTTVELGRSIKNYRTRACGWRHAASRAPRCASRPRRASRPRLTSASAASGSALTTSRSIRQGANLFFQLVSRRYEKGSILLTSNQSLGAWGEVFGDPVIASPILDRLLHHATTVNIKGESYRLREKRRAGLLRTAQATEPVTVS